MWSFPVQTVALSQARRMVWWSITWISLLLSMQCVTSLMDTGACTACVAVTSLSRWKVPKYGKYGSEADPGAVQSDSEVVWIQVYCNSKGFVHNSHAETSPYISLGTSYFIPCCVTQTRDLPCIYTIQCTWKNNCMVDTKWSNTLNAGCKSIVYTL